MTLVEDRRNAATLERVLDVARRRIEVSDAELDEARRRRKLIASALASEFPGSRGYVNGSIAHGDALTPLTDVDLGVVVPNSLGEFGPGRKGPTQLEERAANAIRRGLNAEFDKLRVEYVGRKRSILVSFGDPVTIGQQDFTADVIVAIDNESQLGLYIPRYQGWDRSHPEMHTKLVREAVASSKVNYSRTVRLLKHWNRTHGQPLCSWNIKALALGCLDRPMGLIDGLSGWFRYAIHALSVEETPDPAGVASHPIKISEDFTMSQVLAELRRGMSMLDLATELERQGFPELAVNELARFFNDSRMLPFPDQGAVMKEQARRTRTQMNADSAIAGEPSLSTATSSARPRVDAKSWAA